MLTQRGTFGPAAAQLLDAAVQGRSQLHVASLAFSHIYYVLRKTNTPSERTEKLTKLARLVQVVAVDGQVIAQALASGRPDFEDAIQYFAAAGIPDLAAIVTRDPRGFAGGQLPVLSPAEALRLLI